MKMYVLIHTKVGLYKIAKMKGENVMSNKMDPYKLFTVDGLSRDDVTRLAFESEFCKRKSGKIEPPDFLLHFCLESLQGTVSYNDLAAKVESKTGVNVSRQAYHQRMGESCVTFFKKFWNRL